MAGIRSQTGCPLLDLAEGGVQVGETFGDATGSGTLRARRAYGPTVPHLTAHPAVLADERPRARAVDGSTDAEEHRERTPLFAAPFLILVAAMAIFEGYHWLQLFPKESLRPTSLIFALLVAPATFALTRHLPAPRLPWARRVARASSTVLPILAVVLAVQQVTAVSRVLGVASLVLALSLVVLVVDSERRRWPVAGSD